MKPEHRLILAIVRTSVLMAVSVLLHDIGPLFDGSTVSSPNSNGEPVLGAVLHFNYLAWPMALAAGLGLIRSFVHWIQTNDRQLSLLNRVGVQEPTDQRRQGQPNQVLEIAHALLGNAVWLVLILGLLLAVPQLPSTVAALPGGLDVSEVRPYLDVFESMAPWAFWTLATVALVRTITTLATVVGRIAPVPYVRLMGLGGAYLLMAKDGVLATGFQFRSPQLLLMVALAFGLPYLASVLNRAFAEFKTDSTPKGFKSHLLSMLPKLVSVSAGGCAGAALTWGLLNSLPELSAALLAHGLTSGFGESSLLHFGQLYDLRHLFSASVLVLVAGTRLPHDPESNSVTNYRPYVTAVGLTLAGYACWLLGARLAPLGHGYLLIGGSVAVGLFFVALGELTYYVQLTSLESVSRVANWLTQSRVRAFLTGGSIGSYFLLFRPLFYEILWFAQLFEWVVVVAITVIVLKGITDRVKSSVVSENREPDPWMSWARHGQTVKVLPDARFEAILSLHRLFLETGNWRPIWTYLLGLMFRNGVRPEDAQSVFLPLSEYSASSGNKLFYAGLGSKRGKREEVLLETYQVARVALSHPSIHVDTIDEQVLRAIGEPFAKEDGRPDSLAVMLAATYWQSGASLTHAIELWFPLIALKDFRPRWFYGPRARTEIRQRNRVRRQRIVDGAIAHLFGEDTEECLPLAIIGNEAAIFSKARTDDKISPVGLLKQGQAIEITGETQTTYKIRTGDGVEGYIETQDLVRQPLLPKDLEGQRSQNERP